MKELKIFPRARAAIKEAKEAIRTYRKGMRDGELDEDEAVEFVKESFEAAEVVFGEVKLSDNAKNVVRALCHEMIRRMGGDSVRAKLACTRKDGHQIEFEPDYTSEVNKSWAEATPCAQILMVIDNPPALAFFDVGKEYLLDFSRAPKED